MATAARPTGAFLAPEVLDLEVDRELRGFLAKQLASETAASEVVHVVLAAMAATLVWHWVPHYDALMWVNAVAVAAFGRAVFRRTASTTGDARTVIRAIRKGVGGLGLAWGAGILLVGPALPLDSLAWITVLFAGLVAGATMSLLADPVSFFILLTTLLVPLGFAIGISGGTQSHVSGILLTALYGVAMAVFYRRSHVMLLKQFRVAKRLELTERTAGEARETAQQLSRIIESTPDHVVTAAPDGRLRYLNSAGRTMLGIGAGEDVTGMTLLDLSPPRLRDQIRQDAIPKLLHDGLWSGESTFVHRDGREIRVSVVAQVHRAADGSVESISAVARDITEQVAARKALKAARDAAEQASVAKSEFLANMSHEIRTPMNGVIGMTELALGTDLSAEQREYLEMARSSADSLLSLINDILDFSKIEARKLELDRVDFDVAGMVDEMARALALRAHQKGLELVYHIASDVPNTVRADPARLRQVLMNLVSNAVKFTETGEVVIQVSRAGGVKAGDGHVALCFSVMDTGIGIPQEKQRLIFEAFSQADTSTTRRFGGTGLGLAIASQLVTLMGGKLTVESEAGKGSSFSFTIPVERRADILVPRRSGEIVDLQGMRVLVVDDHAVNRRILKEMLGHWGMRAELAEDGRSAIDAMTSAAARGAPFALVLLDYQMPDMDGFAVADAIMKHAQFAGATIMMLSSVGQRGDAARCREMGIASYLTKPIRQTVLLDAIQAALAGRVRPSARRDAAGAPAASNGRSLSLLVAEDNPVNRALVIQLLKKRGHSVVVAENGVEAVAASEKQRFDAVFMDIQMPEMDGLEATAAIRKRETETSGVRLPIIALTAHAMKGDRERCLAAGMDGYLTKPIRPADLDAALTEVGGRRGEVGGGSGEVGGGSGEVGGGSGETGANGSAATAATSHNGAHRLPPVGAPVFDPTEVLERVGGDRDLLAAMVQAFRGSLPRMVSELRRGVESGDSKTLARAAHMLKGSVGNFGDPPTYEIACALEGMARDDSVDDARAWLLQLEKELRRLDVELVNLVGAGGAST